MEMKFTSHKNDALREKDEALARAMEMIGLQMEGYAKDELDSKVYSQPERGYVRTGRLRNSITYATKDSHSSGSEPAEPDDYDTRAQPSEKEVVVGTNVEYATYIEFGTSKMGARPYLKPALMDHLDEYKEMISQELHG